ncbi:MAG: hypothetical protein JKX70_07300 [Phycisphaerales bacterium]|nr:hypothetical protein [Phycisphaerales bacterium]
MNITDDAIGQVDNENKSSFLVEFLNNTEPAKLMLWCAAMLILAGVCGFASFQLSTGWGMSTALEQWQSGSDVVMTIPVDQKRASFTQQALPIILSLGAFVFGIAATLLPMWAVGRLIADAIRDGAKS